MAELVHLCRQLAEGSTSQKVRAWSALRKEGSLWRLCLARVRAPDGAEALAEAYDLLGLSWNRAPLLPLSSGGAAALEAELKMVRRLVAAAVAGALCRRAEFDSRALFQWASLAADLETPETCCPAVTPPTSPFEALSAWCAAAAASAPGPERARSLTFALDAARAFHRYATRARAETPRALRVPILLARGDEGFLAWLWLEAVEHGCGTAFLAPEAVLCPLAENLRRAVEEAWSYVIRDEPPMRGAVRWRLLNTPRGSNGTPVEVYGASLQAAAAIGFRLLLLGRGYDAACVASACLSEGFLQPVAGITDHGSPKLHAALQLRPEGGSATVVVSPDNRPSEATCAEWDARGVRIVVAETFQEALELAGSLIAGLLSLAERQLEEALRIARRRTGWELRDWNEFDRLFFPGRVTRDAVRRDGAPLSGSNSDPDGARTLTWEEVRDDLRRTLVLADAGYGKTTLLLHEVARRNAEVLAQARGRTISAVELNFALYLQASELAETLTDETAEALPNAVLSLLNLEEPLAEVVRVRLCEGSCVVAVDAVDEVPDIPPSRLRVRLHGAIAAFLRRWPRASLLLSSRRDESGGRSVHSLDLEHVHLLGLDAAQQERAVRRWLEDDRKLAEAVIAQLRVVDPLRGITRIPLVLRLGCRTAASTRQTGATLGWRRRSDLYEAFVARALAQWPDRVSLPPTRDQRADFPLFLADLAALLILTEGGVNSWPAERVAGAVARVRAGYPTLCLPSRAGEPARDLLEDLCATGLLVVEELHSGTQFAFLHRSFADYLAARSLAERLQARSPARNSALGGRSDGWDLINHKAWDPSWRPVIAFLAGQLADPTPLLRLLCPAEPRPAPPDGDDAYGHRQALAVQCLAELPPTPTAAVAALRDAITAAAFGPWWQRRLHQPETVALPAVTEVFADLAHGRYLGVPVAKWLWDRLHESDPLVRAAAADALIRVGGPGTSRSDTLSLLHLLQDDTPETRKLGLALVSRLGDSAATPLLARIVELLADPECWRAAVSTLRGLTGREACENAARRLRYTMRDADPHTRLAGARAMGCLALPAAERVRSLVTLLTDAEAGVREAALAGLRSVGARYWQVETQLAVLERLQDDHARVRESAVESLTDLEATCRAPELLERLTALLAAEPACAGAAGLAFRRMGLVRASAGSVRALDALLGRPARSHGAQPLPDAGPPTPGELRTMLAHREPSMRQAAVASFAAGTGWSLEAQRCLVRALRDSHPAVRAEAAEVAQRLGASGLPAEVAAALQALVESELPGDRGAGARALRRLMLEGARLFPAPDGTCVVAAAVELACWDEESLADGGGEPERSPTRGAGAVPGDRGGAAPHGD